jgi:cyanophycinase-like exopeptidase
MGSGEMTRPMSRVHRWVISRIEEQVRAVFQDTPAGFELNADDISQRACSYVAEYVGVPCSVVSFKVAGRATDRQIENALRKLKRANYIFAGPGSPTYAVRNWRRTPVFDLVARRVDEGAHLVLASAAAIALGRYTLPVYEIYKVGEEPHWVEGLDLLASHGMDLAIVSHWNNAEGGTFDTRYCFMGQPRFRLLEELLPDSTVVLGIDEYTACLLDLGRNECRVMGAGQVTIRQKGREAKFEAETSFSLDHLRSETAARAERLERPSGPDLTEEVAAQASEALLQQVGKAEETLAVAGDDYSDLAGVASYIYELAQSVHQAQEAGLEEGPLAQARDSLRQLLIAWSSRLASSPSEAVASIAPLVQILIDVRSQLRAAQQWALGDEIRDRLSTLGIVLEDGPTETTWRRH